MAIVQTRLCCLRAWEKVEKPGEAQKSFTKIIQSQNEPFVDFISRLKEAIDKTVRQSDLREMLLQTLSFENANSECQKVIRPLKAQGASLEEYIKACADIGSEPYKANLLATALQDSYKQNLTKCFNCGKLGHVKKDCKKEKKKDKDKSKPPGLCPKCKRGKHWANECRSKFDKNGQPLQQQGNWTMGPLPRGPTINNTGYQQFPLNNPLINQN